MIGEMLMLSSSGILGIFLGAQLTEAFLFVPYWKAMDADDFFGFYQKYGKHIHQFFAPLTIVATLVPLITVGYGLIYHPEDHLVLGLMGTSTLAFFSSFFLYFRKANEGFATRNIADESLPAELTRWGNWHWGRVGFESVAFVCSLVLQF
ncbi:MAG: hypothetical protein AAGI38_22325 [Bacteroidota bacterium]